MKPERDITPTFILKILTLYIVLFGGYVSKSGMLSSMVENKDTLQVATINHSKLHKQGVKIIKAPLIFGNKH